MDEKGVEQVDTSKEGWCTVLPQYRVPKEEYLRMMEARKVQLNEIMKLNEGEVAAKEGDSKD